MGDAIVVWNRTMHDTQRSVYTHEQLTRTGLTDNEIRSKIRRGELERLRRGVYRSAPAPALEVRHRQLIDAALTVIDPTTVVSHVSAGVLHGLPVPTSSLDRATVTRRLPGHGKWGQRLIVRNSRLDDDEVVDLDGVLTTTLARTASDLARTSHFEWGVAGCDAALGQDLERSALTTAVGRHPRLHGVARARRVVDFADGFAESPAESLSRVAMDRVGVPRPVSQFEIHDDAGEFIARCDFGWPHLMLVGEIDGRGKYGALLLPGESPADAIMREKQREERIREYGYDIVRWDWDHATHPRKLEQRLLRVMRRRANLLGVPLMSPFAPLA